MPGRRYRLAKDTRAVHCEQDAKGFVLIPEGALISIDSFDATGRLIRIVWGSQLLLMFSQDLLDRGVEVEKSKAAGAPVAAQSLP